MIQPKLIERESEFLCQLQHPSPIEFVILDSQLPFNQRLLCKICGNQNLSHLKIVDYQSIKSSFDEQHRDKIKQYEQIINPHILCIENLKQNIESLKTRLNQQIDNLLSLLKDWVTTLLDSISSYSLFEELDKLESEKMAIIDTIKFIGNVKKTHEVWNLKLNLKLNYFKSFPEFKRCQDNFEYINEIINFQETEMKSQPIIQLTRNSYLVALIQSFQNYQWKVGIKEQNSFIWDIFSVRFIKTKFLIKQTKDKEIQYIRNGSIIRSDTIKDISKKPFIFKNLQQIQFLKWVGNYGENNQQVGKWTAIWKGEIIKDVGGQLYSLDGKKEGIWKELIKNYWNDAQVYEVGEYQNDQRRNIWKQVFEEKEIGGGEYNQKGEKNGKWKDAWEKFSNFSQLMNNGEYQNGKKIGKWDIWYTDYDSKKNEKVGGGEYDEGGDGIKLGKWIEQSEGFWRNSQVTYHGEYINGKKVSKWDIYFAGHKIGGGEYDEGGDGIKLGKWIEQSEGFWRNSQVTYKGDYQNGIKVGRWDIYWYWDENRQIGGGSYDEQGDGIKIGRWIELVDEFDCNSQVTYLGNYANGKKVNRWDILYRGRHENTFKQMYRYSVLKLLSGGGLYDEGGNGIKIGRWVEQSEGFGESSQINYLGEYQNGSKVGRWNVLYRGRNETVFKQIGGGSYDEGGDGIKLGRWIEVSDGFYDSSQIMYEGDYKNGKKVGMWDILYRGDKIGGGLYDEGGDGIKLGKWIELWEGFYNYSQMTFHGEYKNGKKVGTWVQMDGKKKEKEIQYDN